MHSATIDARTGSSSTNSPPTAAFVLREADGNDFNRLMKFYRSNVSPELPTPSITVLGRTLDQGRLLVIEPVDGGELLATAATFDFTPPGCSAYVGELSGTRVLPRLNGFGPMGVQRLLIAARLLAHAAGDTRAKPGFSNTLISIVKAGNDRSSNNLIASGLVPMQGRPDWMRYEEHAWYGSEVKDEWSYYAATDQAVTQAITEMGELGMLDGKVRLSRVDKHTGRLDVIDVHVKLGDILMAKRDFEAILASGGFVGLVPPPAEIEMLMPDR